MIDTNSSRKYRFPTPPKSIQAWIMYGFIAICAIIVFFRAGFTVLIGDALIYSFCLGSDFLTTSVGPHISSLHDVLVSQYNQYFAINGRFLLHSITQVFAGLCDPLWFGAFDSVIVALIFIMFAKYARQYGSQLLLPTVLFVAIFIFYDLEPAIVNSIPHNVNYLWPEPLVLLYILTLKKAASDKDSSVRIRIVHIILGFCTGITQETFVFPLCVTTLAVVIYKFYKHRRLSSNLASLIIPLWIGGALIGLAPGTMHRSEGAVSLSLSFIVSGMLTLAKQIFFWGAVLMLALALRKQKLMGILWRCRFEICLFAVSFCFILVAHTTQCSYSGISFFSLLLIIALLGTGEIMDLRQNKQIPYILGGALALVISFHQAMVAYDCVRVHDFNQSVINQFCQSDDNIVVTDIPKRVPLTRGFNTDYASARPNPCLPLYLTLYKDPHGQWPVIITPDILKSLKELPNSLHAQGDADAYIIGEWVFVKENRNKPIQTVKVTYQYNNTLVNRVRQHLLPSSLPVHQTYSLDSIKAFQLSSIKFYPIYDLIGSYRIPVAVDYVE